MNAKNNVLVPVIMLIVGFGIGSIVTNSQKDDVPMTHTMTSDSMMDSMISGLMGKTGDEFDKAFINEMIIHHKGAVAMAQLAKVNANHQEIKSLADAIIMAQTEEISSMQIWMENWYGENPSL